jgi:Endoribonuclease L-PSP
LDTVNHRLCGFTPAIEVSRLLVARKRVYKTEEIYETRNHSGRAAGDLPREVQGARFDGDQTRRHYLRLRLSAVRSEKRRDYPRPFERHTEIVLDRLKLCVETAGSSLENIQKLNVYLTSVEMFPAVNEVYRRHFPENPPARIFINVPAWNGGFDIEVDCVAAVL